jgi:hypothetical protein
MGARALDRLPGGAPRLRRRVRSLRASARWWREMPFFGAAVLRRGWSPVVLTYPRAAQRGFLLVNVCQRLGCRMVDDPAVPADLVVYWDHLATVQAEDQVLLRLKREGPVLNGECRDIRKSTVQAAAGRVLGYTASVDPRAYAGGLVRKSEENAAHDGELLDGPIEVVEPGKVYERFVDTEAVEGFIEDLRVPVVGDTIPVVYRKYRPASELFNPLVNTWVVVSEPLRVFAADELSGLVRLARALHIDFGEFDVLRDRADGRMYVVDANPTPRGPPGPLPTRVRRRALRAVATAFERQFLGSRRRDAG